MKKVIFALSLMFVFVAGAFASDIFFVTEAGKTLTTALLDKGKGKPIGYFRWTVKSVEGSGGNMSITYVRQELDKNRKPVEGGEIEHTVNIVDGAVEVDWIVMGFGENFRDLTHVLAAEGRVTIPSDLAPGYTGEDSHVYVSAAAGDDEMGVAFRAKISLTNQKCVGIEKIKVPAGTFEQAFKVTSVITAALTENLSRTFNITAWYVKGVGPVKINTYDESGKLLMSRVLYEKAR